MHLVGALDDLRADLGQADMTHIARLDQVGDRADGVFHGHRGIVPGEAVDIDVVGT